MALYLLPRTRTRTATYPLVQVVASKLHRRVRDDTDTIRAVASHEAPPALFTPHLAERLADGHIVLAVAGTLDLEQNLDSLERRDDGARDGACDTAGAKRRDDWLGHEFAELGVARRRGYVRRHIFRLDRAFGGLLW